MGGDGGSFSGRAEMVRTKGYKFLRNLGGMGYTPNTQIRAGDERLGKNENRDLRTSACALSEEKLRPPLVACRLGRLYNKEKVLCAMLEKTLPAHMKHVRSLKDMRECEVEINASTGFPVCPITKADLSSGVRACIVWPCGFIVSNRALEAMTKNDADSAKPDKGTSESGGVESGRPKMKGFFTCPMCSKEHSAEEDLIPLCPDEEEAAALLEKALMQQQAKRAAKKQKTQKAEPDADAAASRPSPVQHTGDAKLPAAEQKEKSESGPPVSAAAETTEESILKRLPAKRLRDWVLESELDFIAGSAKEVKHRQVAAK